MQVWPKQNTTLMITGNKIRAARLLTGISVKQIAAELEIDYSTYYRIESGQIKLTEKRIAEILQLLKVPREFVERLELDREQDIAEDILGIEEMLKRMQARIEALDYLLKEMEKKLK